MSTATGIPSATAAKSLASSTTFRTFATVCAIATPIIYTACEMQNWPLFTYHPGSNRVDLGWAAAVKDEGPAMYWYGWTATTLIGAAILGMLATMLPEKMVRSIPLSLVWIVPLAMIPILVYALRFFWRW
jgi:DNA-binding transcriptional LysR family regulator